MLRCLISLVKWVFANFPFTLPLLVALFFLIHINSVFAADSVPADAVTAEPCEDWITYSDYGNTMPWAGKTGCSAPEAAEFGAATFDAQFDFDSNFGAGLIEEHKPHVQKISSGEYYFGSSYKKCTRKWGPGGACDQWEDGVVYGGMAYKRSENVSYRCPPRSFPDYKVGPLEKEDGTKWCTKGGDSCSLLAGTKLPEWRWFFADFNTCTNGCRLRPYQSGSIGIYVYSEFKGNRVFRNTEGAIHTGESCDLGAANDSDSDGSSDQPSESDPATETATETGAEDCQITYSSATGQSSCTASHEKSGDGTKCGYINDVWTCVDGPYTKGTQTDKTGQANGDGTATETTQRSETECVGDDCKTTTSTSTETRPIGGPGDSGSGGSGGSGGTGDGDGDGEGSCTGDKCAIPGEGEPASWWESSYPDGIEGVWSDFADNIQQTEFLQFVRQFEVDVGGGAPPDFNICFTALWDLGCHSIAPPDFVWSVMRLFMLITAAFTCRKLIFGG